MYLKTVILSILCLIFALLSIACEEPLPAAKELPEQAALPDAFIMLDGTRIETQEDWYNNRRPELKNYSNIMCTVTYLPFLR